MSTPAWIKSSYSGDNAGNCVEVAPAFTPAVVPVRDSKSQDGPALLIGRAAWDRFLGGVVRGA
ncbi:DUF397 domain-containing protein [Streptomyces sp. NPDC090306]|uniref:DUF397 domain-containing protein n=1 Tax=Streptomyces sp. NPDC090306 TaxID=3365961 RepID=UPI00381791C0